MSRKRRLRGKFWPWVRERIWERAEALHAADFYRGHGENVTPPTRRELREGGYSVEEFKEVWRRINGWWDPDAIISVYEFQLSRKESLLQET